MNYKKQITEILNQWKADNNLVGGDYIVHHRDDTEECRAYNKAHYKRWGFNEDGTFEYGKYVVFMTRAAHNTYHKAGEKNPMYGRTGENHPMYGKKHTEEAKAKISAAGKGRQFSDETRAKISAATKGRKLSNEWCTKISIAGKGKHNLAHVKFLYTVYKNNGGEKKWNDFQKALKTGDITFSDYKITVFKI